MMSIHTPCTYASFSDLMQFSGCDPSDFPGLSKNISCYFAQVISHANLKLKTIMGANVSVYELNIFSCLVALRNKAIGLYSITLLTR